MKHYFINFSIILILLFSFSFTNVFSYDLMEDINTQHQERDRIKAKCLNLKENNFSTVSSNPLKLMLIYYNGLLDTIINNNQDILSYYNKKDLKFCIYPTD